jgi:hypothetical protein
MPGLEVASVALPHSRRVEGCSLGVLGELNSVDLKCVLQAGEIEYSSQSDAYEQIESSQLRRENPVACLRYPEHCWVSSDSEVTGQPWCLTGKQGSHDTHISVRHSVVASPLSRSCQESDNSQEQDRLET